MSTAAPAGFKCQTCNQPVTGVEAAYKAFDPVTLAPAKADMTNGPCGCVHEVIAEHALIYRTLLLPKAS